MGYFGDWGYLNGYFGWVDVGRLMEWFYVYVRVKGLVNFIDVKV